MIDDIGENILSLVAAGKNYDPHVSDDIRGHKQLSVLKETYESQLSSIVKLNTSLLVELDKLTHIDEIIYRPITSSNIEDITAQLSDAGERLKTIHDRISQFSHELEYNIDLSKKETAIVTSLPVAPGNTGKIRALIKKELSQFKKDLITAITTELTNKFTSFQNVSVQHFEEKSKEMQRYVSQKINENYQNLPGSEYTMMPDEQSTVFQKKMFTVEEKIHVLKSSIKNLQQNYQGTVNEIDRKVNDQNRKIRNFFNDIKSEKSALEALNAELSKTEISKNSFTLNKKVDSLKEKIDECKSELKETGKIANIFDKGGFDQLVTKGVSTHLTSFNNEITSLQEKYSSKVNDLESQVHKSINDVRQFLTQVNKIEKLSSSLQNSYASMIVTIVGSLKDLSKQPALEEKDLKAFLLQLASQNMPNFKEYENQRNDMEISMKNILDSFQNFENQFISTNTLVQAQEMKFQNAEKDYIKNFEDFQTFISELNLTADQVNNSLKSKLEGLQNVIDKNITRLSQESDKFQKSLLFDSLTGITLNHTHLLNEFINLEKQVGIIKLRVINSASDFSQNQKGNLIKFSHGGSQDKKILKSLDQIQEEICKHDTEIVVRQQEVLNEIQMICETAENTVRMKVKADTEASLDTYMKSFEKIKSRGEEVMKSLELKETPLEELIEAEKTKYEAFMLSVRSSIQELKPARDTCVNKCKELNDQVADIENIILRLTEFTNSVMEDSNATQKSLNNIDGIENSLNKYFVSVPASSDGKDNLTDASKMNIFKEVINFSGWYFVNRDYTKIDEETSWSDTDSEELAPFTPSDIDVVLESLMQTLGTSLEEVQTAIDLKTVNNIKLAKGSGENNTNSNTHDALKNECENVINAVKYLL